jgi:hypothetical protein
LTNLESQVKCEAIGLVVGVRTVTVES